MKENDDPTAKEGEESDLSDDPVLSALNKELESTEEMGSLLDFALLLLLCLLKSEQSRFEGVRKIVYRSTKSSNDSAPGPSHSSRSADTHRSTSAHGRPMVLASIHEAGRVVRIVHSLWTGA